MSPRPQVSGVPELSLRWGVSRQTVNAVVKAKDFPEAQQLAVGRVWSDEDIAAWEKAERAAGRPLPGQVGYGPLPGTGGRPPKSRADDA